MGNIHQTRTMNIDINFDIDDLVEIIDDEKKKIIGHNEADLSIFNPKLYNMNQKTTLVLSGGGIKGIAHIGALNSLERLGILKNIKTIIGTSVGSLIGTLFVAGYTPTEMLDELNELDLAKLKHLNVLKLIHSYGIDDGKKITSMLEKLFIRKKLSPKITFSELLAKTGKTLVISATCLNTRKLEYFSPETTPDMNVLFAVRMSISIPFYFIPVFYDNKIYVDGGCLSNYPIDYVKTDLKHVIGLYLWDDVGSFPIDNIENFAFGVFYCFKDNIVNNMIGGYAENTIEINTSGINPINFGIDENKKRDIYDIGFDAVTNYFS